jgi:hypothetical protein
MSISPLFKKIEIEIMKILSRNPGNFVNQYILYNGLLENFEINDPLEKDNFKMKFLIVLRQLSSIFNNVTIKNDGGIFSAGLFMKDEININIHDSEIVDEQNSAENTVIDGTFDDAFNDTFDDTFDNLLLIKKKSNDLNKYSPTVPSDIAVINFIVDESIAYCFNRKDYLGNSILHNLIMANDYERVKKIYLRDDVSFFEENNATLTPVDYITDIRISTLVINILVRDLNKMEDKIKINELKFKYSEEKLVNAMMDIQKIKTEINSMKNIIFTGYIIFSFSSLLILIMFNLL